jgi:hypothetical protein
LILIPESEYRARLALWAGVWLTPLIIEKQPTASSRKRVHTPQGNQGGKREAMVHMGGREGKMTSDSSEDGGRG